MRARSTHSGLWQPGPDKTAFPGSAGPAEREDPGGRRPVSHQRPVAQGAVLSGMWRLHLSSNHINSNDTISVDSKSREKRLSTAQCFTSVLSGQNCTAAFDDLQFEL